MTPAQFGNSRLLVYCDRDATAANYQRYGFIINKGVEQNNKKTQVKNVPNTDTPFSIHSPNSPYIESRVRKN